MSSGRHYNHHKWPQARRCCIDRGKRSLRSLTLGYNPGTAPRCGNSHV